MSSSPSLDNPNFVPHEFKDVKELFKQRFGWVPPSERSHLKELLPNEKLVKRFILKTKEIEEEK